jgi:hypothetical protein
MPNFSRVVYRLFFFFEEIAYLLAFTHAEKAGKLITHMGSTDL